MANQTSPASSPSPIGSWEELASVTFDAGRNSIVLESEAGGLATIPCDDLAELHRLAQITYSMADGYDVRLKWRIPVAAESNIGGGK